MARERRAAKPRNLLSRLRQMHYATVKHLSADLAAKRYSSVELTRHFLNRINTLNETLHCFITLDEGLSLAQARRADEMLASGRRQPLTGIPVAHKDIFCTAGWKTSCGSRMLDNFISP